MSSFGGGQGMNDANGRVTQVQGSVVDVYFPEEDLPEI